MLLAFDTASPTVTVAVHDGNDVVAAHQSEETMRHGEQLAPLIERTLAEAALRPAELTAIAVGTGPGPFTGLRVGLVTARTLGHVLGIPIHGICSLDALAVQAVTTGTVAGPFEVATDARRKEVYLAGYDGEGRRISGPVVDKPAAVASNGPVVGEGAALYPDAFSDARGPLRPSAEWIAVAVQQGRAEILPPEPLYLRRPDAEIPRAPKPVS